MESTFLRIHPNQLIGTTGSVARAVRVQSPKSASGWTDIYFTSGAQFTIDDANGGYLLWERLCRASEKLYTQPEPSLAQGCRS